MAVQPVQQLDLGTGGGSEGGFIRLFNSLPEKSATTVRVFDRTDYYTVHGDDALLAAREIFHTNAVIKELGHGEHKLASVVLSRLNFEAFVRDLLLVKQYRVEIYQSRGKGSNWTLAYKASPGNLQELEDVIFSSRDMELSTCVMAVKLASEAGQLMVGVACFNGCARKLSVSEFVDNELFSNLEALLVQLSPRECLLQCHDTHSDAERLTNALKRCKVLVTDRKKGEFNSKDIVQDLNRLLKIEGGSAATLAQVEQQHAMSALSALIKYLELLSDETNFSLYHLESVDLHQYMRLDGPAARALSLTPQPRDGKLQNLFDLLNRCKTPQGQRLLGQWIKQPLMDKRKIDERLDIVEALVGDTELRQTLEEDQLRYMPDLYRLGKKIQRGKGSLQDCVRVYQAVQRLPGLAGLIEGYTGPHHGLLHEVFLSSLKELIQDFDKYLEMVEATIDLDQIQNHEFVIKPSFDEGLQELRDQMEAIETKIHSLFSKAAIDLGLEMNKTIRLDSSTHLGHCFRVTRKYEKSLRGQKRYAILETKNDGVRFANSALRQLSTEYQSLKEQYTSTQAALAEEVLNIAGGYAEPMNSLSDLLAQLDVFVSFANVSACAPIPYVRPNITPKGEGDIVLEASRHPCLEMQDDIAFIANDVSLIRGEDMFQIITGPNMGGKSTYIRQVGVVVLMAQIGCFVPCQQATVSIVDCILARVGASDSQMKGVSTFMAEMLETAAVLKSATSDSLIIIDELGRGTSTYDGFGLAWAISQFIATKIGCFCLFATHFHELTALEDAVPCVSNRHVTALTTNDTLTLLYRVNKGVCDQSFGIHVAELAQFPQKVVEFARQMATELEISYESEPKSKRPCVDGKQRREEIREGEEQIEQFLSSVQALPVSDMAEEDMRTELNKMKDKLLQKGNPYIRAIVDTIQC